MDPRLRWLLGVEDQRTRTYGYGLAMLAMLAVVLALALRPTSQLAFALAATPAVLAIVYALWNGGPLLALFAGTAGAAVAVVAEVPALFDLVALPAGLAGFGLAAWRASRSGPGPPPLGEGVAGPALLMLWAGAVVAMCLLLLRVPEEQLGPRVWGDPAWVPWLRTFAVWGPAGLALGWAVARRGPVLCFVLATAHLWPAYVATWAGVPPRDPGALYLGELLLSPPLEPVRGVAMLGLGVVAVALAMAFEPAWPWLYRRGPDAAAPRQV